MNKDHSVILDDTNAETLEHHEGARQELAAQTR